MTIIALDMDVIILVIMAHIGYGDMWWVNLIGQVALLWIIAVGVEPATNGLAPSHINLRYR